MLGFSRSARPPEPRRRPNRASARQPVARRSPPPRPSTAGSSSPLFSYHANRARTDMNTGRQTLADQPSRRKPNRLRQAIVQHKWWVAGATAVLLFGLFQLQLDTTPKIVPVTTSSDAPFLQDESVYARAAQKLFAGSAANRNKLTVNAPAIASRLRQMFPELRDVSVSLPFVGAQPVVYVQPSSPAAILTTTHGTYVLDNNGRALIAAGATTDLGRFQVPTVADQTGAPVHVGQATLPRTTTDFITTITRQCAAKNIAISRMVLPPDANELRIYPQGRPYYVKFNIHDQQTSAAALQVGTYLATAQYLSRHNTTVGQYIDVRVTGRAYYK